MMILTVTIENRDLQNYHHPSHHHHHRHHHHHHHHHDHDCSDVWCVRLATGRGTVAVEQDRVIPEL